MMKRVIKLATAILATALVAGVLLRLPLGAEQPSDDEPGLGRVGNVRNLRTAYNHWKAKYELNGGDRNLVLALGWSKGLSAEFTKAKGQATLDLIGGSVSVEVHELPEEGVSDVWLIDNRPGPGHSMMPEPGDAMLRLGRLKAEGGVSRLQAYLGRDAFQDFDVDLVVVTRDGEDPSKGGVLFGSPTLFQRLYRSAQRGRFRMSGNSNRSPFTVLVNDRPAYASPLEDADDLDDDDDLVELISEGEDIFFNETFDGNGRTCGTCHPAENNFTIDPAFIAKLPPHDPLFVAEFIDALNSDKNGGLHFEVPELMRKVGLILENIDGFDDLENKFVLRGVPHVLGLSTSVDPPTIPFDNTVNPAFPDEIVPPIQRTGWSGDGAPGSGSLRDFAAGAVRQHFPLTLNRKAGVDFRLPTEDELDQIEAFMLSLGRQEDRVLSDMNFTDPKVQLGVKLFNTLDTAGGTQSAGKCALCHENAGANINSPFFTALLGSPVAGNANFGTGVNDLPNLPGDLIADPAGVPNPPDGGFGLVDHDPEKGNCLGGRKGAFGTVTPPGGALPPGLCEEDFNTPPLVEAADTGPFFHNNSVDTIEAAVAFYNDDAFNGSVGGQLLAGLDSNKVGIRLASTEVTAIAALLRVLNALENIRISIGYLERAKHAERDTARRLLKLAKADTKDGIEVLESGLLHPKAIEKLKRAKELIRKAKKVKSLKKRSRLIEMAIPKLEAARASMVGPGG